MTIDLNRFINTFFEEAFEHLETIERKAMSFDYKNNQGKQVPHDPEILNAIFRAAHSIKGGSSTFGLNQLTAVTHEMETMFDSLRKGVGQVNHALIRLLLDSCDVFKIHLTRLKNGDRSHDDALEVLKNRFVEFQSNLDSVVSQSTPGPDEQVEQYGLFEESSLPSQTDSQVSAAPENPVGQQEKYGLFDSEPITSPPTSPTPSAPASPVTDLPARPEQSSIRVSVEKIDRIVNLVGELVIAQAMLQQAALTLNQQNERLTHGLGAMDRNARDLQQAVMSIRMVPMEFVFSRFPRQIYDLSAQLNKKVQLRTQGDDTELDKEMIEQLIDPLTHVVRNAVDHGIETPEERLAAGKPETGTVTMRATHRGGSVVIEISDDGCGLNRDLILAKAIEKGFPVNENTPDQDLWPIIFEAGFSTAKKVTQLSGRGVGMDVVRRNIGSLGGHVSISSVCGVGTTIKIQLPLTLAVLDGMIVAVADEQYIVPLEFVAEAFKPTEKDIRTVVNQAALVAVRGEHLPIVRLEDLVGLPPPPPGSSPRPEPLCLVVEIDGHRTALLVDALIGQQQLVVKSLDTNLHSVKGVAGATILGDGHVALILDVSTIVRTGSRLASQSQTKQNPNKK